MKKIKKLLFLALCSSVAACAIPLLSSCTKACANGHSYETSVVEATCTQNGETKYTCTVCGDTYSEVIEASHAFEKETVKATCQEEGYTREVCTRCGEERNRVVLEKKHSYAFNVCSTCGIINLDADMANIAVHDPSVLIAYVDDTGVVYPTEEPNTRKIYFIIGTHLGAAYSFDMQTWAVFQPTFYAEGTTTITKNYAKVFASAAQWSKHDLNSATVKGNLWAADMMYNPVMQKWCIYYSVNGDDWLSSDVLLTADQIGGPYVYSGTVVYGGMDSKTSGAGNEDFKKVTGETTIPSRYYKQGSNWHGDYGVSAIDPAVTYDKDGNLWMIYGSWSGGIFLLKLDETTGLRDYAFDYSTIDPRFSSKTQEVWDGTRLLYDPYMGIHLAGGYYVSGEGPYVEYIDGYYYLFISYGFYSPDGGYNMHLFRSENIYGPYVDAKGNSAIFDRWRLNYGGSEADANIGVRIMQNYKWDWQVTASVAQGHNSAIVDTDGNAYLVYHTKYNDGSAGHNVETHRMVKNERGWYLVAPFEKNEADALALSVTAKDVIGTYGVIVHKPLSKTQYETLCYNAEEQIELLSDGTVQGAYRGTWKLTGDNYIRLTLDGKTYYGALLIQRMEGREEITLTFTAMNDEQLCIWGYRSPEQN